MILLGEEAQMEIFRQSIEQLAAPICDTCKIEMAWSRSALRAVENVVLHVFACSRCNKIAPVRTPVKPSGT